MTKPVWHWQLQAVLWGVARLPIYTMLWAPWVCWYMVKGDVHKSYKMAVEPYQICFPEYFDNDD